jgi:hypothetical protein
MTIQKSELNFYELTNHYLSNVSEINLFNILKDTDANDYFLNIFRAYIINEAADANVVYYLKHEVDNSDWPDTISQKYYKTPFLWWAIALFNDIYNPFEEFDSIEFLKILKPQFVYQLMTELAMIASQ